MKFYQIYVSSFWRLCRQKGDTLIVLRQITIRDTSFSGYIILFYIQRGDTSKCSPMDDEKRHVSPDLHIIWLYLVDIFCRQWGDTSRFRQQMTIRNTPKTSFTRCTHHPVILFRQRERYLKSSPTDDD